MEIEVSHLCNQMSIQLLAGYYNVPFETLNAYYVELEKDKDFLKELNSNIERCRSQYPKGLFNRGVLDSIDWFGNQRITLYVLIRHLKPELCVETGVFYGGTTAFILNALQKNGSGKLISIDLPGNVLAEKPFHRHEKVVNSEIIPEGLRPGFIIPEYVKDRWQLIQENSLDALKKITEPFTFFSHDSEHRRDYLIEEMTIAKSKMPPNSTMFADDLDWSNGFIEFCVLNKLYPLFLTDNGKDNLKVRLGLVRLDHPNNTNPDITG